MNFDCLHAYFNLLKESPDSFYDKSFGSVSWGHSFLVFGTIDDSIVYSKEKITHHHLYLLSLLKVHGEKQFLKIIDEYVTNGEIIFRNKRDYASFRIPVKYILSLDHFRILGNWRPPLEMGSRSSFKLLGRMWKSKKRKNTYAISTWQSFGMSELKLIEKMLKQENIPVDNMLIEMGDTEEVMSYGELIDYFKGTSSKTDTYINDLKAKAHVIGGVWGKAIRSL